MKASAKYSTEHYINSQ